MTEEEFVEFVVECNGGSVLVYERTGRPRLIMISKRRDWSLWERGSAPR
jgi:hypothetical protein